MMRRECKVEVHKDNDTATIELHGDLTASATDDMDAAFQEACGHNPRNILLKFGARSRINSTGIAIIINLVIDSREKGHPEKLRGIEGLRARMIGREHEFAELKEAADEWLSGQGQMVSIVGEAGIEKSRLVTESKRQQRSLDRNIHHASMCSKHRAWYIFPLCFSNCCSLDAAS